jgi:LmbE family N-acetylglucosaminyl deacetylase
MSKRILTIFPHPDDAETAAGGTLLRWARQGHQLTLCILTDGDKGTADPTMSREALVQQRRQEQARAADLLGAELVFLGLEDGLVQPTLELRREMVRVMRTVRPHVVVANDPTVWFRFGAYINHPDHRATGQAVVEALYPAVKKPGIFPELMAEGVLPHVVEEVWLTPTEQPDHWEDISDVFEEKMALILTHASQFPPEPTRRVFSRMAQLCGEPRGLPLAESFRTLRLTASTIQGLAGRGF